MEMYSCRTQIGSAISVTLVLWLALILSGVPSVGMARTLSLQVPRTRASGFTPSGMSVDWLRNARIAGLGLHETASDAILQEEIDQLVSQGVSVVEVDSSLSDYLNEADFQTELDFMRRAIDLCHKKGLKVVWYYPSMEVITPEGRTVSRTMKRDHPDWIQKNFDRKTMNSFLGTLAFWVEPNDESSWMCPNSPYREYFYQRVARLAKTGLDGLWLDVPLFNSIVGKWPCADPHCVRKFERETGLSFPTKVDFRDPAFRRWVLWRHETIAEFLKGAHEAGRQVNPDMRTVVEVVSCDHMINTLEGLDSTYFSRDLDIVWEVDAISDTTSMVHASKDDWLTLMMVYKYCQGASERRSRWVFTYGYRDDDAQLTMASALAAQCNPYETRIPQMVTTVGHAYRSRMFHWIEQHNDAIFGSRSASPVAIAYSPASRDFVDGTQAGGFYVSQYPPNPAFRWWVLAPELSVVYADYLAEYRGWAMMLIDRHIPFDIVTVNQIDASTLGQYRSVVLPSACALSNAQRDLLVGYANRGGNLIVTGPKAGTMDETGASRGESLWPIRSHSGGEPTVHPSGSGRIVCWPDKPGKRWLKAKDVSVRDTALGLLGQAGTKPMVSGDLPIYVQVYEDGKNRYLHLLNYGWVGKQPLVPTTITAPVSMPWTQGTVGRVVVSEPGLEPRTIAHSLRSGQLFFQVPVRINALVMVEGSK